MNTRETNLNPLVARLLQLHVLGYTITHIEVSPKLPMDDTRQDRTVTFRSADDSETMTILGESFARHWRSLGDYLDAASWPGTRTVLSGKDR